MGADAIQIVLGAAGGAFTAIVGGIVALKKLGVDLRKTRVEERKVDSNQKDRDYDRVLDLLDKFEQKQKEQLDERQKMHEENLALRSQILDFKTKLADMERALQGVQGQLGDRDTQDIQLWNLLFQHAPDTVLRVGRDGSILDANSKFEERFGYSVSEAKRMTFQDITHPDDLDPDVEMLQECLEGNRTVYMMQKRYRTKFAEEGEWLHCELRVVAVRRNGVFKFFTSYIRPLDAEEHTGY